MGQKARMVQCCECKKLSCRELILGDLLPLIVGLGLTEILSGIANSLRRNGIRGFNWTHSAITLAVFLGSCKHSGKAGGFAPLHRGPFRRCCSCSGLQFSCTSWPTSFFQSEKNPSAWMITTSTGRDCSGRWQVSPYTRAAGTRIRSA